MQTVYTYPINIKPNSPLIDPCIPSPEKEGEKVAQQTVTPQVPYTWPVTKKMPQP